MSNISKRIEALEAAAEPPGRIIVLYPGDVYPADLKPEDVIFRIVYDDKG